MEFNEKLQKLRTGANLTQEELAEKLYVSRAAVSKWESGRGYPSIDSLKAVARFFNVTIDELIGSEETVALAEQDKKESKRKYVSLICGILDCFIVLLFFLPIFGDSGQGGTVSVSMFQMTGISEWLKILFAVVSGVTVLNGFCSAAVSGFDKPALSRRLSAAGVVLSAAGTVIFMLARQPYAGVICFCVLAAKVILFSVKSK